MLEQDIEHIKRAFNAISAIPDEDWTEFAKTLQVTHVPCERFIDEHRNMSN